MRKFKIRIKIKRVYLLGILSTLFLLAIVIFGLLKGKNKRSSDFKIGVLADDGIALVSISLERKMINVLKLGDESKLWIPGGLGWYRNISIKQILNQEKKIDLIDEVFFYNFGFKADRIVVLNEIDDWKKKFWLRFRLNYNNVLMKEEIIKGDLKDQANLFDEVMIRDFSETNLVREDLLLSVFNTTEINGLAGFLSRRLEWLGFSVMTIETLDDEKVDNCLIKYGSQVDDSLGWKIIGELFDSCDRKYDYNLNQGEIEFYFGDQFSSMIKYPSYN